MFVNMAILIPILLIVFVIVFSQPVETPLRNGNYNGISEFSPQNKIQFKKFCIDINNFLKQIPLVTLYSVYNTTEIHPTSEIIFCNLFTRKTTTP